MTFRIVVDFIIGFILFGVVLHPLSIGAEDDNTWECLTNATPCPMRKFYVTFPRAIPAGAVIEVQGRFRIDALSRIGATVWTEKEWKEAQESRKKLEGGAR